MAGMSRRGLRRSVDSGRVVAAIQAAERACSGEFRVSVAPFFWGSVDRAAARAFDQLGMAGTAGRNGVLIFLVPSRRRFAVRGDAGIHAKAGQAFWDDLAACLEAHFRRGDFTEGLVQAIGLAGERLAPLFPPGGAADRNELPDEVDFS